MTHSPHPQAALPPYCWRDQLTILVCVTSELKNKEGDRDFDQKYVNSR